MRLHDFFSRADFNRCYLPSCIKSDPTNHWWMASISWLLICCLLIVPWSLKWCLLWLGFWNNKVYIGNCFLKHLFIHCSECFCFGSLAICMSKNLTQSLKHGHVFIKITTLVNQKVVFIIGISNMHFRRHLSHIFHWTQFILFTSIWCSSILLLYSAVILSEPQSIYLKLGHFVLKIGWVE